MKALSLRQPWAWAITHLPEDIAKRIENRIWRQLKHGFDKVPVKRGETIALHASKTEPKDYDWDGVERSIQRRLTDDERDLVHQQRGHITGVATTQGVLRTTDAMDVSEQGHFPRYVLREGDLIEFLNAHGPGAPYQLQGAQLDRWWLGPYAFWLTDVVALRTARKHTGALMFWQVDAAVEAQIREEIGVIQVYPLSP